MPSRARWAAILALAVVLATSWASATRAAELPSGFRDQIVFSGLEEPTTVRFAPNGLVFVAEKTGLIEVYNGLADPMPTLFADLRTEVYDTFDRGLLGLALDPGFPAQPYVYALYTYDHLLGAPAGEVPKWGKPDSSGDGCEAKPKGSPADACPVSGRLVRLTADAGQGYEKAVTTSGQEAQQVLVEGWCAQFSSHSIGDLQFGPEGALYASGGDGSDANGVDYGAIGWPEKNQCGDPPAGVGGTMEPPSAEGGALRAQDARTPNPLGLTADPTGISGAVIRIDPDSGEGWAGNPLEASLDPNERRLVGYGFRNPFRFSIDPVSGELYVGNVGWNNYEEVDRFKPSSTRAFNSGWPCYEGPGPNQSYKNLGLTLCENLYAEPGAATPPFFYYHHSAGVTENDDCPRGDGSAISGNALYRGGKFPAAYEGAFFFSDPVRGCIYVMFADDDGAPDPTTTMTFLSQAGKYPGVDVEEGPEGNLFYVSLFSEDSPGEEFGPGAVHRIYYDPDAPFARLAASQVYGKTPLKVALDASASSDPNGEALSFEWDLDGNGSFETSGGEKREVELNNGSENVEVAVLVTDGMAKTDVARVKLFPGDTPPLPIIKAPSAALQWGVGQAIHFEGSATDAEDGGALPAVKLFWKSRLYHCPQSAAQCHVHPLQAFPSTASGTVIAPDHDYPSRIELTLTAVDSRGLTATKSLQVLARPASISIASEPPGLGITAGVFNGVAPFTIQAIESGNVTLAAPLKQELGGHTYSFEYWSDGGSRVHSVSAGAASGYTAFYSTPSGPPPPPPEPPEPSPRTRLVKRPPKVTRSAAARFEFASDPAGAMFECKLGAAPYKVCRSPRTYRKLQPGPYVLRIRAVNAEGTVDATPVLVRWKVLETDPSGAEGRKQAQGG
ncbi:MAG TPA: PQQ-dependent sugar dehydrogenase [Solirubrobacterales bacterium]|nr:PQQ-dependent sugar dehydrogenase [Solirubrobacterales bacterium]